jgi:2-hydroxychromene-2-carboxylate isomerase
MGADKNTGPNVEFWFEFGSSYSYLSVMRIDDLTRASGLRIVWRPFLLGPIFRSLGWSTSPLLLHRRSSSARKCSGETIGSKMLWAARTPKQPLE